MKILFLSPNQNGRWNPGHQYFRNEIGKATDTMYYGPGYLTHKFHNKENHVPTLLRILKDKEYPFIPDIIMTYGLRYTLPFTGLGEINIPKVHFLCDFHTPYNSYSNLPKYNAMLARDKYDILFGLSYNVMNWFFANEPKVRIYYLPFGVDPNIYKPIECEKTVDYFCGWSYHDFFYPMRKEIKKFLEVLNKKIGITIDTGACYGQKFINRINQARINLSTSSIYKTINLKPLEVMACGGVLIAEDIKEFFDLGFTPHKHYYTYRNMEEFALIAKHVYDHPEEAKQVAIEGRKFVLSAHTNYHRVLTLMEILHEKL